MRLEEWLGCDDLGIEIVEDQRPIMLGKLPVLHGHELPKGLTNPVNMARGAYLRTAHTILVGHGHRTSGHSEPDLWREEVFCWSTGCLCDMRPEYARINKWNHGFAFVEIAKDKSFDVSNLRIGKDGVVRSS
jgi:predicted phosphodiesterase